MLVTVSKTSVLQDAESDFVDDALRMSESDFVDEVISNIFQNADISGSEAISEDQSP